MSERDELRVTVHGGGLPDEVVDRIVAAVQDAVRREVASIDLLAGHREADEPRASLSLDGTHGGLGGIAYEAPKSGD